VGERVRCCRREFWSRRTSLANQLDHLLRPPPAGDGPEQIVQAMVGGEFAGKFLRGSLSMMVFSRTARNVALDILEARGPSRACFFVPTCIVHHRQLSDGGAPAAPAVQQRSLSGFFTGASQGEITRALSGALRKLLTPLDAGEFGTAALSYYAEYDFPIRRAGNVSIARYERRCCLMMSSRLLSRRLFAGCVPRGRDRGNVIS